MDHKDNMAGGEGGSRYRAGPRPVESDLLDCDPVLIQLCLDQRDQVTQLHLEQGVKTQK